MLFAFNRPMRLVLTMPIFKDKSKTYSLRAKLLKATNLYNKLPKTKKAPLGCFSILDV